MQYFKPPDDNRFAGDCMPFFHAGVFHLFYLLDEGHHSWRNGLGGHQWAHASSRDLIHWQHHPLALAVEQEWEGSICTGSVIHHAGAFHAFYATRMPDWSQHLGHAVSADGIHFKKTQPNPLMSPPPAYAPDHFRDPCVFRDERTGLFHMLVSAWHREHAIPARGGCLAHLVSPDLWRWEMQAPFLVPGYEDVPECPDYFVWNGWHYLVFSNGGTARYRLSRDPFGPWAQPAADTLDGPWSRVMKTAAFGEHRRIGVAWIGSREGDRDAGRLLWGGHIVCREITQGADGSLGSAFVPEMTPPALDPAVLSLAPMVDAVVEGRAARFAPQGGLAAVALQGVPRNARLKLRVRPETATGSFGARLREAGPFERGCELRVWPAEQRVTLGDAELCGVSGLDRPCDLDIVLHDDLIDVCVDGRRCLINRFPEAAGEGVTLFSHMARVAIEVRG
jgi:hypothetical protein